MKKTLRTIASLVALISAAMTALLFVRVKAPRGYLLWMPRLLAGALAPFFGLAGLVGALAGLVSGAWLAVAAGLFALRSAWLHLARLVIHPHLRMLPVFDRAFGHEWERELDIKASPQQKDAMLRWRWSWLTPPEPAPDWVRDLPFWEDAVTGRKLLCDIWLPPSGVPRTGLGVVYFHGSAWYMGDKDFGTRAFFRHLAAQGHVIIDAQYRLSPEVDLFGMIADVKQAIAWTKANADRLGIDPARVVTGGASAGGQLALLAAYAPQHPDLTPPDLSDADLSVRAVFAYYGPADLSACYYHTNQDKISLPQVQAQAENPTFGNMMGRVMQGVTGNPAAGREMAQKYANMSMAGLLEPLLGGTPVSVPERYALVSPITHAGPLSPPTFLVQGEDDLIVPVEANRRLAEKLDESGVPVIHLVFPYTDHGFDLMLPRTSPSAQSAQYDLDRFLALVM